MKWLTARLAVRALLAGSSFLSGLTAGIGWESFLHSVTVYVPFWTWFVLALVFVGLFIYALVLLTEQMISDCKAMANFVKRLWRNYYGLPGYRHGTGRHAGIR